MYPVDSITNLGICIYSAIRDRDRGLLSALIQVAPQEQDAHTKGVEKLLKKIIPLIAEEQKEWLRQALGGAGEGRRNEEEEKREEVLRPLPTTYHLLPLKDIALYSGLDYQHFRRFAIASSFPVFGIFHSYKEEGRGKKEGGKDAAAAAASSLFPLPSSLDLDKLATFPHVVVPLIEAYLNAKFEAQTLKAKARSLVLQKSLSSNPSKFALPKLGQEIVLPCR